MRDLQTLLAASAQRHRNHLCPRQVLGVRMGLYAAELFGVELPQSGKRIFAFVETDGCLIDGVAVSTGCWFGSRTMHLMDYGKTAATFVDMRTEQAIRIFPHPESRTRALTYAPDAPDRWHAQLAAYQVTPSEELLRAQEVTLVFSLAALISKHGQRIVCERCGEDILTAREVRAGDTWVSNDPYAGGSHLPDITVMSPVFREGRLAFLVANRGHHADVGGPTPGSMPADSRDIADLAHRVLQHRLILGFEAASAGVTPNRVIDAVLQAVRVP